MTFTSSGWHRLSRSGETPEQTMDRVRLIRIEALERDRLAIIDMTLIPDDLVERVIRDEFDRQNGPRGHRERTGT